jgi:hypothetical protein
VVAWPKPITEEIASRRKAKTARFTRIFIADTLPRLVLLPG